MSAYLPTSITTLCAVAAMLFVAIGLGLWLPRVGSPSHTRAASWIAVAVLALAAHALTLRQPAGFRMLAICGVVLYAMKIVVTVEHRVAGGAPLPTFRWLSFAVAWPGMQPAAFARQPKPTPTAAHLVQMGLVRLALGILLIIASALVFRQTHSYWLATALVLPGLSLSGHFGVFNIVAGFWRMRGADCDRLFVAPAYATSLSEFWGRRWNLAFSDMARLAVYFPLRPRAGRQVATLAAFLFSGLLHELAISVPVQAGFGFPLLYFVLHAGAMQIERVLLRKGHRIDRRPWVGRAWTAAWLVLPMPLLFHTAFLRGVVWPIIGA